MGSQSKLLDNYNYCNESRITISRKNPGMAIVENAYNKFQSILLNVFILKQKNTIHSAVAIMKLAIKRARMGMTK